MDLQGPHLPLGAISELKDRQGAHLDRPADLAGPGQYKGADIVETEEGIAMDQIP